jgi:hypothetical protein
MAGNLSIKSILFPHCNIHKYTWTSDGKKHSKIDHILIVKGRIQTWLMSHILEELTVILIIVLWMLKLDRDCQ